MSEEFSEVVGNQVPRADTLTDEQIKIIARNNWLVSLIQSGLSPNEALKRLQAEFPDIPRSARWAQKLYMRYREKGARALLDNRYRNKQQNIILTDEVQKITLGWWYARSAAGPRAIWKQVTEECKERDIKPPSYQSIKKFLAARPEHDRLVRAGKIAIWDKQGRPVVRFALTSYANERWQIDHSHLPIWIREKAQIQRQGAVTGEHLEGIWVPCPVWLTLLLDAHSRAVAGFYLSRKVPDAWTTSIALRHAILPKANPAWRNRSLPSVIQPDCGKDFLSNAVAASLAFLGIIRDEDPPYYPQRKGRVERLFRTINDGCLRILPGHHQAVGVSMTAIEKHVTVLLTRQQLAKEIERFIVEDYHVREHSETGRKPSELWEETVRLRMPQAEDALDAMLLKSDKVRRVRNTGVDFHLTGKGKKEDRGGRYWAPELVYHAMSDVHLRYNPEDLQSVLIYCAATGEYICEAWIMGEDDSKYDISDVKRARSQFRRGLVERMKDYAEEIHEHDRRAARQAEWNEARELADEMTETPAPDLEAEDVDKVERLLAEFERRDRGEG
jgi:putative transposase